MWSVQSDVPVTIEKPGVYDMPDDEYHRDPVPAGSLSSSGARKLLPPSCPALFRYWAEHRPPPKKEFDIGHAAHKLVLGSGPNLVPVEGATDWRTKAAKQAAADIRTAGGIPLLQTDLDTVQAMAAELRNHYWASRLLDPNRGHAEQSLFVVDDDTGVWLRGRLDYLPHPTGGRVILADYKTSTSANPDKIRKAIYEYGYYAQGAWYLDLLRALGHDDGTGAFVLIVQEKAPPYLVTCVQIDADALHYGRRRNRQAVELFAECLTNDYWPGYRIDADNTSDRSIALLSLPPWVRMDQDMESNW